MKDLRHRDALTWLYPGAARSGNGEGNLPCPFMEEGFSSSPPGRSPERERAGRGPVREIVCHRIDPP